MAVFFIMAECSVEVIDQSSPRAGCGIVASNQHIVMSAAGASIKALASHGTEAAFGSISDDGIADFAGSGESQSWGVFVAAVSDLHDQ